MQRVEEDKPVNTHANLPRYRCHKVVRAGKIEGIAGLSDGRGFMVMLEGGMAFDMNCEWFGRHKPKVGGYYVVYEDGYVSFSPADAFESGYTRIDDEQNPPENGAPQPNEPNPRPELSAGAEEPKDCCPEKVNAVPWWAEGWTNEKGGFCPPIDLSELISLAADGFEVLIAGGAGGSDVVLRDKMTGVTASGGSFHGGRVDVADARTQFRAAAEYLREVRQLNHRRRAHEKALRDSKVRLGVDLSKDRSRGARIFVRANEPRPMFTRSDFQVWRDRMAWCGAC